MTMLHGQGASVSQGRHVARLSVGCLATPHLGEARVDEIRLDGHAHQQKLETRVLSSKNHPHLLQWEP